MVQRRQEGVKLSGLYRKQAYGRLLTVGGLAILLAGRGPNESDQTPPTGDIATASVMPQSTETPALDSDVNAASASDAMAEKNAGEDTDKRASFSESFPVKFQGRWAIDVADCAKARGMETTVMTIKADVAEFYESSATLKSATLDGDALTAKLGWMGEGQTWESDTVLTLKDGGRRLTRSDADEAEALTYTKCPE